MLRRRSSELCLLACVAFAGCIPYTVGHTAKPARKGEIKSTTSLFMVNREESVSDWNTLNYVSVDVEARAGVTDRADVGLRVLSASGLEVSYMRRMNGRTEDPGVSVSAKVGAGMIDIPWFLMGEAALLVSGDEVGRLVPYGGLRVVQTKAVDFNDKQGPTAGAFFGTRLGSSRFGLSPEIGVFYDKPFPGVDRKNFIVVPSISLHGNPIPWLQRLLGRR